jgi:peptidoglycan/LPS O-acetylase OafA/YrhL
MAERRYETLDALRGVAAIAVVVFHLSSFRMAILPSTHAYLAVDFFFVLSGFVVAHAYGAALLTRMSWLDFVRRRMVRLMPLSVLGAVVGLAVLVVKWRFLPGHNDPLGVILGGGLLNIFLLPTFWSGPAYDHEMFPGDGPLWSLFFEMAVNLAWARLGPRLSVRSLAAFVGASAVVLIALSVWHGSTRMGVEPATFWGGVARSVFGFNLGVLIYRVRDRLTFPAFALGPLVAAAVVCAAFLGPLLLVHDATQALVWDLVNILVILPATVAFAAAQGGAGRIGRLCGEISYPIYVLHWPCLAVFSGLHQLKFARVSPLAFGVVTLVAAIAVSWAAYKIYDEPVRRWLSGRFVRSPRAAPLGAR